jgi:dihydrolipoamide dehydrogenase
MTQTCDIAIIGAGPGGYVAAIRAAQLGKSVTLIEKEHVGGTCMNWGCIPTKFLLHETGLFRNMRQSRLLKGPLSEVRCDWPLVQDEKQKRVDKFIQGIEFLIEKNGVTLIQGSASLREAHSVEIQEPGGSRTILEAGHIILALGSRPSQLPFLVPDGKQVLTSREALELEEVPPTLLIVGAGAIGLEMGTIYHRLGSRVTILEILPQILPGVDRSLARRMERILKSQGMDIRTRMQLEAAGPRGDRISLRGTCLKDRQPFEFSADKVLLATGRRALTEGCGLASLEWDDLGFLSVNENLETDVSGVYAIGDLIGGNLLAHKASHEGIMAVENIAGANHNYREQIVPMAVYTEPELATVGWGEEEAKDRLGSGIKTGMFSLQANGRALTMGEHEGVVKVVADAEDRVVGAQILAPYASELISEMTLAVTRRMSLKDVAETVHIHPSLSEAVMEAALHAQRRAIHVLNL